MGGWYESEREMEHGTTGTTPSRIIPPASIPRLVIRPINGAPRERANGASCTITLIRSINYE